MKNRAFTLAEMMVVMLILTIVLAAFAPMMTKRKSVDSTSPWKYATNNSDAYYGVTETQTAMIGQNAKDSNDPSNRLTLNTGNSNQYSVLFKQGTNILGAIRLNSSNFLFNSRTDYSTVQNGSKLTALGAQALASNTSGSNNTAIGASALSSNTTGGNNTAVGSSALVSNTTTSGNTAFGYQTLFSNATGAQNTAIGASALQSNQEGSNNTAIGANVMAGNKDGSNNTVVGSEAFGHHYSGIENIAIGYKTLGGDIIGTVHTETNYNTVVGSLALSKHHSSNYNTAIGYKSLGGDIVGSAVSTNNNYNTVVGSFALGKHDSGNYNTAIGYKTLGALSISTNIHTGRSYNTAVGSQALGNNYSGEYNTAVGVNALLNSTSGNYNTAVGYGACSSITSASYKTCIGYGAGPTGGFAELDNDKIVYIGDSDTKVYIPGDLQVVGQLLTPGTTSDRRLKNVKGENKSGLGQIRQLKVYDFTFKKDETKAPHVGVMAQDLQKIFPNSVSKDTEGYLRIRWDEMFYGVINAVKELDKMVQNLIDDVKTIVSRLDEQEKEINALRAKNQELEKRLQELEKRF